MATALMDRPTTVTNEWNHSCTPQCPNPCPYSNHLDAEPMVMETINR